MSVNVKLFWLVLFLAKMDIWLGVKHNIQLLCHLLSQCKSKLKLLPRCEFLELNKAVVTELNAQKTLLHLIDRLRTEHCMYEYLTRIY